LQDGGACGLAGKVLGGFIAFKEVEGDAAAAAGGAASGVDCVLRDDRDVEARSMSLSLVAISASAVAPAMG
jgi:hypothetical protein